MPHELAPLTVLVELATATAKQPSSPHAVFVSQALTQLNVLVLFATQRS